MLPGRNTPKTCNEAKLFGPCHEKTCYCPIQTTKVQISLCIHNEAKLFGPVTRNPVIALCKQQRRRSACASAQSDQRLCCSLPGQYNTSSFYIRNFKPLPSFCDCADRFESTLVANPEDRFSCNEAQIISNHS